MRFFKYKKGRTCWPLTSPRPATGRQQIHLAMASVEEDLAWLPQRLEINEEKNAKRTLQMTNITGKVNKYSFSCLIAHKLIEKTHKFGLFKRHLYCISIYIKEACLSVCLFVCSDLEPKLLDGFQPNLAWSTPWYLWVTSKCFFGFWKSSKSKLSPYGQDVAQNSFAAPFAQGFFFGGGGMNLGILFVGRAERGRSMGCQRVGLAKRPAPS